MCALAIIPARVGSKGIPNKNFRGLCGATPLWRAVNCALIARVDLIAISTDNQHAWARSTEYKIRVIDRPAELAQDDTPMLAVIQHALQQIPGPPDQQILLLQPTAVLREPKHLIQALALLTPKVDSVVSVVELPLTHSPDLVCVMGDDRLKPYPVWEGYEEVRLEFGAQPCRRQDAQRVYQRDGTAYCFWRKTITRHGNIYGHRCVPLMIPPEETCALDTMADWAEAERRLREL